MSREYVEQRLQQIGVRKPGEPEPMRRAERNALILLRAKRGDSYAAIGKDLGLSAPAVSNIARTRGEPRRGSGRPKPIPARLQKRAAKGPRARRSRPMSSSPESEEK